MVFPMSSERGDTTVSAMPALVRARLSAKVSMAVFVISMKSAAASAFT